MSAFGKGTGAAVFLIAAGLGFYFYIKTPEADPAGSGPPDKVKGGGSQITRIPPKVKQPPGTGAEMPGGVKSSPGFETLSGKYLELPIGNKYNDEFNELTSSIIKGHPSEAIKALSSFKTTLPPDRFRFFVESLGSELGRLDFEGSASKYLEEALAGTGDDPVARDQLLQTYASEISFKGGEIPPAWKAFPDGNVKRSVMVGYLSRLKGGLDAPGLAALGEVVPLGTLPVKDQSRLASAIVKAKDIPGSLESPGLASAPGLQKLVLVQWLGEDADACLNFLTEKKNNPSYNQWVGDLVPHIVRIDRDAAKTWAGTITDAALREEAEKAIARFRQ